MVDGSTLTFPRTADDLSAPKALDVKTRRIKPQTDKPAAVQLSRAQILHATAICLGEEGYDGTTIRRIAKQLNCAVGSIYRYFDDKRSLLDAVTQARFEPVAQVAEVSAERSAALYAHAAADEPQQYRLMFWLASIGQPDGIPGVPAVVKRIIDTWAIQMGDRRKAERFWSQLHGRIMLGEVGPNAPATQQTPEHTESPDTPKQA
jgi:AcrR family transcriptional regulator